MYEVKRKNESQLIQWNHIVENVESFPFVCEILHLILIVTDFDIRYGKFPFHTRNK